MSTLLAILARLYGGGPTDASPQSLVAGDAVESVHEGLALAERTAAGALLDQLPFGIVVVDAACRCEYVNRAGQRALVAGEYLCRDNGFVRAAAAPDRAALSDLAAHASSLPAAAEGAPVTLHHRDGRPVRLLTLVLNVEGGDRLVLLLPDLARARALGRLLEHLFGLTPAEADVSILMMQGLSLGDVARARGVGVTTVRSQWQTAAWKVGTTREGVVRILRHALVLPLDESDAAHGRARTNPGPPEPARAWPALARAPF